MKFIKRKKIKLSSTKKLTQEIAKEIYKKTGKFSTALDAFKSNLGHDWTNVKKVFEEAGEIVKNIDFAMKYKKNKTKNSLKKELKSEILDTSIVLNDYMNDRLETNVKNPKFEDFKKSYLKEEV